MGLWEIPPQSKAASFIAIIVPNEREVNKKQENLLKIQKEGFSQNFSFWERFCCYHLH
jgi:hypothetical protein